MSLFKVSVVARNTKDESQVSQPIDVLVDTGSELTWLPRDLLTGINVTPVRKRNFYPPGTAAFGCARGRSDA